MDMPFILKADIISFPNSFTIAFGTTSDANEPNLDYKMRYFQLGQ